METRLKNLTHLRPITQIAYQANDAERKMEEYQKYGAEQWTYDLVTGEHLWAKHQMIGKDFQVKLAFNYDLFEPKVSVETTPQPVEMEIISTVRGQTCNVNGSEGAVAHLGYRVENLEAEIARMAAIGFKPSQISQTVNHTGAHNDLYRYVYFYFTVIRSYLKAYQKIDFGQRDAEKHLREGRNLFGAVP